MLWKCLEMFCKISCFIEIAAEACWKITFCISVRQHFVGKFVISDGMFLRDVAYTKNYWNRSIFHTVIRKIKGNDVFETRMVGACRAVRSVGRCRHGYSTRLGGRSSACCRCALQKWCFCRIRSLLSAILTAARLCISVADSSRLCGRDLLNYPLKLFSRSLRKQDSSVLVIAPRKHWN